MAVMYISDETPIRDVVLMPDHRHEARDDSVFDEPTFRKHASLGYDVEVTPVDEKLAGRIRTACDPAHHNRGEAVELRSTLYAFVRYNAPREQLYRWDPDQRLQELMVLSRLVHPASISLEFAARVIGDPFSDESKIVAGPVKGLGSHAWVVDPKRNWLAPSHVPALAELFEAFQKRKAAMSPRVRRAM